MNKLEEEKVLSNFEKVNEVKDYVENTHSLTIALDLIEKDQRIVELEKENAELKAKLENAIVPKFKLNEIVYYYEEHLQGKIVSIGYANKGQSLTYFYYNIKPMINGTELLNKNCIVLEEKFIYNEQEAEEALKKLERRND